jgi:hypothetical protein
MMNSDLQDQAFAAWCELSGLTRDFVRRNFAAVRARYDADPLSPLEACAEPVKRADRYDEL